MNSNGQPLEVSQDAVINGLLQRVQQLTIENVMLQAALEQLRAGQGDAADIGAADVAPS